MCEKIIDNRRPRTQSNDKYNIGIKRIRNIISTILKFMCSQSKDLV